MSAVYTTRRVKRKKIISDAIKWSIFEGEAEDILIMTKSRNDLKIGKAHDVNEQKMKQKQQTTNFSEDQKHYGGHVSVNNSLKWFLKN